MPKKPITRLAIPPTPICVPLELDGEDVLLLSSTSVAQWKASLGPATFEERFTNVLVPGARRSGPPENGKKN